MLKRLLKTAIIAVVVFTSSAAFSATTEKMSPAQVVRAFYSRYISKQIEVFEKNSDPIRGMTRQEALRYMTNEAALYLPLDHPGPPDPNYEIPEGQIDHNYFLKSQDYSEQWATSIYTKVLLVDNDEGIAIVKTTLGEEGYMRSKLIVILVKPGRVWKIDKVLAYPSFDI
ncbi:MAG: YbjP/YqhG family protein [Azoarcus sp.]|nr:YbjP/YqhG family protein [Azoarcus sp.]